MYKIQGEVREFLVKNLADTLHYLPALANDINIQYMLATELHLLCKRGTFSVYTCAQLHLL